MPEGGHLSENSYDLPEKTEIVAIYRRDVVGLHVDYILCASLAGMRGVVIIRED